MLSQEQETEKICIENFNYSFNRGCMGKLPEIGLESKTYEFNFRKAYSFAFRDFYQEVPFIENVLLILSVWVRYHLSRMLVKIKTNVFEQKAACWGLITASELEVLPEGFEH